MKLAKPTRPKTPPPPKHLKSDGKELWGVVTREYDLPPDALTLLRLAAEALDRSQAARREIDKDGLTFVDSKGHPRSHPAATVERDSRAACARLLGQLGLDLEPVRPGPGRPPGR